LAQAGLISLEKPFSISGKSELMAVVDRTPKVKKRAIFVPFCMFCAALLVCACAMLRTDKAVYYSINYPTPVGAKEEPTPIRDTLMIYKFLVAPDVDVDTIVVKSQTGKEITREARWEENPADAITELLIRDFQDSKMFANTVSQISDAKYRYALEGTLATMEGRDKDGKIRALIGFEITLIDFEPRLGGKKVILSRKYSMEKPSKDSRSASLVNALNQGLREFSERLRADVLAAVKSRVNLY